MATPAALPNEEEEIEISPEIFELLSAEAAQEGCTEEEVLDAALRWFLENPDVHMP